MRKHNLPLQQIADKQGITKQAVWFRTPKGKAYQKAYHKAYQKTDKYRAYQKAYKKRTHNINSK